MDRRFRSGQRADAVAVALHLRQMNRKITRCVVCDSVVDQRNVNILDHRVSIERKLIRNGSIIGSFLGGAVARFERDGDHRLIAAGALHGKARIAVGFIRGDFRFGKSDRKRFGRVVVADGKDQRVRRVIQAAAVAGHQREGALLHAFGYFIFRCSHADGFDGFTIRKGDCEGVAEIGVFRIRFQRAESLRRVQIQIVRHLRQHLRGGLCIVNAAEGIRAVSDAVFGINAAEIIALRVRLCRGHGRFGRVLDKMPDLIRLHLPAVGVRFCIR